MEYAFAVAIRHVSTQAKKSYAVCFSTIAIANALAILRVVPEYRLTCLLSPFPAQV